MSADRAPPLMSRWRGAFWFYLDHAGPAGFGGWIAPRDALDAAWIDIQFSGVRVRAPLVRDGASVGGRPLLRFSVPLALPSRAHVTFGVGAETFAALVLMRRGRAPIVVPAPPARWREPAAPAQARGKALVVLAPIDWCFRQQRSQHLTKALSAHYGSTYYLGPASLLLEGDALEIDGVTLPFMGAAPASNFAERAMTDAEARSCADKMAALLGDASFDLLVQFPAWRAVAKLLPRARVIYDCIDDHARLPHVSAPVEADERALIQDAALSVATSAPLQRRLEALGAHDVLLAPNATHAPNPAVWPHRRDAAIVYLGAVETWFDFALLKAAADAVPEAEVRVIGACNIAPPRGLPSRIRFAGEWEHAVAMQALIHARVGLIPFRCDALTAAVNPVKAYEYLAAGLPVVMTPMGGAELADAPGVSVAETAPAFAAAVARAYAETREEDRHTFAQWAQSQTWTARAAQIVARLNV